MIDLLVVATVGLIKTCCIRDYASWFGLVVYVSFGGEFICMCLFCGFEN